MRDPNTTPDEGQEPPRPSPSSARPDREIEAPPKTKKARARKPISRILSRMNRSSCLGDHFSGIRVTSNLKRPTRRPRPGQSVRRALASSRHVSSYLALHRATLTVPVMSPPPRWALTPPFHPYLSRSDQMGSRRLGHRRFVFCGAGVGLLRLGVTQRPAHGVRTFLPTHKLPSDHPVSSLAQLQYRGRG